MSTTARVRTRVRRKRHHVLITCPICGGAVDGFWWERGPSRAGHRRGTCVACSEDITVVVHPTYSAGTPNVNAPFYELVLMVDAASAGISPEERGSSTGAPPDRPSNLDVMESTI